MTREEAKEALSVLKIYDNQWLREAVDMAIEALSETSGDQISRSRLFNKLATVQAPPEANEYKAEVYKIIQSMGTEENDDK